MLLHLDSPTHPFITQVPQRFAGWIVASTEEMACTVSLHMDAAAMDVVWTPRPDVEAVHPTLAVRGFSFWFDTLAAARKPGAGRVHDLTVYVGDRIVAERRFLMSRNFVAAPGQPGPIFWMHIPKTAGTSLAETLATIIPADRMLRIYAHQPGVPADQVVRCPSAFLDGVELIYGHFAHALHDFVDMPRPRYVTVLRDPVELLRSYIAFNPDAGPDDPFFDNPLTRYLSGEGHEVGPIGPRHMAKAKANVLRDFVHIGYTHELARTTAWFAGLFGLPAPEIPRINTSDGAKPRCLPPFAGVQYDLELYNWCRLEDPVAAQEATALEPVSRLVPAPLADVPRAAIAARSGR